MNMSNIRTHKQSGFTLLEILLVVVIIGMLVTIAAVRLGSRGAEAKKVAAQRQIDAYRTALNLYELDNGMYPTAEQGLQALVQQPSSPPTPGNWKGPYLEPAVLRKDPWNRDYTYKFPGQKNAAGFDLASPGPDGVDGNEDDIGNWQ
jgi:general secretion pathway protein G